MSTWGRANCPHCKQAYPAGYWERKSKSRTLAIKEAQKSAKQRGFHIGRPQEINDSKVAKLRKEGMSVRQIARTMSFSTATVFASWKRTRNDQ